MKGQSAGAHVVAVRDGHVVEIFWEVCLSCVAAKVGGLELLTKLQLLAASLIFFSEDVCGGTSDLPARIEAWGI